MKAGEVLRQKAAGLHQDDGQGIAEGEDCGRGGRRGQLQGAGLLGHHGAQVKVGVPCEGRVGPASDGDQPVSLVLEEGDQPDDLFRLA